MAGARRFRYGMGPKAFGCLHPEASKPGRTPIERAQMLRPGATSSALDNLRRPEPSCLNACDTVHGMRTSSMFRPLSSSRDWTPSATTVSIYMEGGTWRTETRGPWLFPRVGTAAIEGRCGLSQKSFKRLWRFQQILKRSELHVPQPVSLRGSTVAQASFGDVVPVSRRDHSAGRTRISTRRFF